MSVLPCDKRNNFDRLHQGYLFYSNKRSLGDMLRAQKLHKTSTKHKKSIDVNNF